MMHTWFTHTSDHVGLVTSPYSFCIICPVQALSLLEHLVKNGAERVIEDARDNLHRVRMLSDFNYYEGPVDKGSGGAWNSVNSCSGIGKIVQAESVRLVQGTSGLSNLKCLERMHAATERVQVGTKLIRGRQRNVIPLCASLLKYFSTLVESK